MGSYKEGNYTYNTHIKLITLLLTPLAPEPPSTYPCRPDACHGHVLQSAPSLERRGAGRGRYLQGFFAMSGSTIAGFKHVGSIWVASPETANLKSLKLAVKALNT